jgi:hypothetical protein
MIARESERKVNGVRLQPPFLLAPAEQRAKVFWQALLSQ